MTTVNSKELRAIINKRDWDRLLESVKPKSFVRECNDTILAQICWVLVNENVPELVTILCLKCLGNSCFLYKQHTIENIISDKYSRSLYNELAKNNLCDYGKHCGFSHDLCFSYDGAAEWAADYIIAHDILEDRLTNNEIDIFRLSIQFLCNLFTHACQHTFISVNIRRYLQSTELKKAIINSIQSNCGRLVTAACIFANNMLEKLQENYFTDDERNRLCVQLLKPCKEDFTSAKETLLHILHSSNMFENIYNNMSARDRLDLLIIIYNELRESTMMKTTQDNPYGSHLLLANDAAEFLALTFCKRSDLIFKTAGTYVNAVDPAEVVLILNILGFLTLLSHKIPKNANRLIINCKYLLKAMDMIGKESNNFFTPITNLSKVAPNAQRAAIGGNSKASDADADEEIIDRHPAYGFKVGLIKVIGNLMYRDKIYQDLFREIGGIPLLLNCCNIDARNPLILQWTILALRNLCEGNLENQDIIRNCKREGLVDNPVLQEMGLTLHEDADGKSIRIAALRRD